MSNAANLRVRVIGGGNGRFVDASIFAVFHDADDGAADSIAELVADGARAVHQLLYEGFVDHSNFGRGFGVLVGDIATLDDWHTERVKKIGADIVRAQWGLGICM